MHTMQKEDPAKILVAAAIGFAAGMLLAPRSGQETREQLRAQADEVKSRAKLAKEDIRTHVREGREQLKTVSQEARDRAKSMKDDLKSDASKNDTSNKSM